MKFWFLRLAGMTLAAVLALGPAQAEPRPVTVFAAASLAGVLDDVAARAKAAGLPPCRCVYAASSALARQIVDGAPTDIFISANRLWVDHVVKAGAMDGATRQVIARNRLVVAVPADTPWSWSAGQWDRLPAALGDGFLAMADPDHVPAGLYGAAALKSLEIWGALRTRVVRAANVRAALALVARGEAAAGVVYGSDLNISDRVAEAAMFPAHTHPMIEYAAVLSNADAPAVVDDYFAFLMSADAQARFTAHGFRPVTP